MPSTLHTTTHAMVLPQNDDILYEVVDNKVMKLDPMGAHEICRLRRGWQAILGILPYNTN